MMIRMMMMTMTVMITIIIAADEDETLVCTFAPTTRAPPLFRERVGGLIRLINYNLINFIN